MKKLILIFFVCSGVCNTIFASKIVLNSLVFNPTDVTSVIQNAFNSTNDTIVVKNVGQPWVVRPLFARSNKVIIFEPGVILFAKQGEFQDLRVSLFNITNVSNVTIIGYGATFRMRKSDYQDTALYTHSDWRHTIDVQAFVGMPVENIIIKGLHLEKSGGDGISISGISGYPNNNPVQPKNILIQDVVCEDNHRQGISVTGGEQVSIVNTVLKDTRGTAPESGVDWEPDWERLVDVSMTNCYFSNNRISGMTFYLFRPAWQGPKTVNFTFNNCHVDSFDNIQGIALNISYVEDVAGSDGSIVFNDCTFRNKTSYSTVNIEDKSALKATVTMNRCFFEQTNSAGNVMSLSTKNSDLQSVMTFGGIELNDCTFNFNANKDFISFADNIGTGKGIRDINGTVTVNNPFGATYNFGSITQNVNLAVTQNITTAPIVNINQPTILQKINTDDNLILDVFANDSDVGNTNGAGISKIIFEVQYNDTIVYTTQVLNAPYTLSVPTTGWQKGIYMVKAIAISDFLNTRNITVVPIEIVVAPDNNVLSLDKSDLNNLLSIYPNPFNTDINIVANKIIASIKIINVIGETLINQNINRKKCILTTSNISKGFYVLEIVYEDNTKELRQLLKQ